MAVIIKRIVCLANSRKLSGRCIAGVELGENDERLGWIRPVSDRENQEVSEYERQYEDGSDPRLLDVINVPLRRHLSNGHQQENWLIDPEYYWEKVGTFERRRLNEMADAGGGLWRNGCSSSNGENDRIPLEKANEETGSLKLVHVDRLHLSVFAPGEAFGKKKRVQAKFQFAGCRYALWVTDPRVERFYLAKSNGDYQLEEECYLTISIGEPYKGHCYKLVAAVIRCRGG